MATRKRHNPEQVVRKLMTADRLLGEGKDVAAVSRELGVSEATYHRWRNQFGGLKIEDAKRLKELERENATLGLLVTRRRRDRAPRGAVWRRGGWVRACVDGRGWPPRAVRPRPRFPRRVPRCRARCRSRR